MSERGRAVPSNALQQWHYAGEAIEIYAPAVDAPDLSEACKSVIATAVEEALVKIQAALPDGWTTERNFVV